MFNDGKSKTFEDLKYEQFKDVRMVAPNFVTTELKQSKPNKLRYFKIPDPSWVLFSVEKDVFIPGLVWQCSHFLASHCFY